MENPIHIAHRTVRVGLRTGLWRLIAAGPLPLARLALSPSPLAVLPAVHAAATPHRLAWIDARQRLTWRQVDAAINRVAGGLAAMGIGPGQRVLIALPNRVEYLLTWFALLRLGATTAHAPYDATPAEMTHLCATARPRLAVAQAPIAGVPTICLGSAFDALCASPPLRRRPTARQGESVVFTSGTTGAPKGAVRDFARLGPIECLRILERLPLATDERHLVIGRLYHSAAQAFALLVMSLGGTLVLQPRFDAAAVWRTLAAERITSLFAVPTMIRRLLAIDHPVPASLRAIVSGAGPFDAATRAAAIRRFGPSRVYDFYGATELGWVTTCNGAEMQARPGTVGRPLAGQAVSIRGADGSPCPIGAIGTVWVRNAQTFSGYVGADPSTGWTTCEDLGRLDADGYLYLAGRARDLVVSGGVNLYPAEIEAVIAQHPQVREIAVVGTPDPDWGERLVAVVVGDAPFEALQDFARARLVGAKVPRDWRRLDALPRTATGKVRKAALRAQIESADRGCGRGGRVILDSGSRGMSQV